MPVKIKNSRFKIHSPMALAQTPSAGALLLLDVLSIKNFAPFVYGRREIFLKEIELGR